MDIISYSKKPKEQNKKNDYSYISDIIKIFSNNMFEYSPPEGLDKMQVENALHSGIACLYKCPVKTSVNYDCWCCTPAYPADILTNNLTFKKCTTFGSDYGVELNVGEDCILLFNNSQKTSDLDILEKYSRLIGEIDSTIFTIVKWCRLMPIPKVRTDSDIAKYKMVMDSVLNGNLINVISDNSDLVADTKGDDRLLKLTDTDSATKLHFLSEFRQEVIKRLSNLYGIPLQMSAKNAQIISDELHGMDIFSLYLLCDRYLARKESFERASIYTGHDWKFDFSDITKHTINDILNHIDYNTEEG